LFARIYFVTLVCTAHYTTVRLIGVQYYIGLHPAERTAICKTLWDWLTSSLCLL